MESQTAQNHRLKTEGIFYEGSEIIDETEEGTAQRDRA